MRLQDYVKIQARNIQRNQEILRSIGSLTRSGVRPGVDTSIANAELSKARLNYIELNNQVQQVQLQLAQVSGLPYRSIVADTLVSEQLIEAPYASLNADTAGHPLINYYQSLYQSNKEQEGGGGGRGGPGGGGRGAAGG